MRWAFHTTAALTLRAKKSIGAMACARSIALNPVRARVVARPEDYPWSGFRDKLGVRETPWLDDDPCYQALRGCAPQRARRYQAFVMAAIPEDEWRLIRQAIQRGQLTGTAHFVEKVAVKIGKRLALRGQGRPRKASGE